MIPEDERRAASASWKRWGADPRRALVAAAAYHGNSLAELSVLLGRERSYLARYVRTGVPRALSPADHQRLSDFYGVGPHDLGIRDMWTRD